MIVVVLFGALAQAACPAEPTSISEALARAEADFRDMDASAFRAGTDEILASTACLSGHVDATLAAQLHRVLGLRAFLDGREEAARLDFAAARTADPQYSFPETLLPRNHPIRAIYEAASTVPAAADPVLPPAQGHLEFDGQETLSRSRAWPTLAVLLDPSGAASQSAYLNPADPLFSYAVSAGALAVNTTGPSPRRHGASLPLIVGAGVGALAAGALYGAAAVSHASFFDPATPDAEIPGLQTRTNTLFYSSVGTGVLAVGAGVGAFVMGRW